jgi:predicted nucleotide-binding protein (sugar kinase/HSP70/actin superfamily)
MKQRRMVSFDRKTDEYLQQYMKEQHVRFPGDAIARICLEHQTLKEEKQEKQKQASTIPPVQEIVEVISQRINRLMETERLFLRNEWFCMEESMKRSMMEIFQEVEEKQAAKRSEIVTAFLEGYNK